MKTSMKRALIAIGLGLWLAPVVGFACEKHAKAAAEAESIALPDQSLYHVDSEWTDQNGKTFRPKALSGRPRLIAMIFTKCPSACPLTVQGIKNVRASLTPDQRARLKVDLFSFDEGETRESLAGFVVKYKLDESWSVHRSSAASVAELAGAMNIHYKKLPSGEFVHANVVLLVDERGVVVAKHEGLGEASDDFVRSMTRVINHVAQSE